MKAETFTTIAKLKANKFYAAAKSGDVLAAAYLVQMFMKVDMARDLARALPEGANIVPVTAIEQSGANQIPHAMAWMLSSYSGNNLAYVDTSIIQANKVFHTGANAIDRLIRIPVFKGMVWKGEDYFLVDDVITMGGSINELALYI